jgi:mono/diheme cytochrome c family protein
MNAKVKEQDRIACMHRCFAAKRAECVLARPVLWHNDAKGEYVNIFFLSVNSIERRRSCTAWRGALAAVGAILLFATPASRAQNAAPQGEKNETTPAGNVETGKKIFMKDGCYECHGREGQGAAQASGPRIGPPQRFIRPFITYVRQPTGQMPPFTTEVISDQELADIYAYLQSRPKATPSKDIPLLNQ